MTDSQHIELLREYSPIARRIAYSFKRRLPAWVEMDDLMAAAMSGLWDALRLHPEGGPQFEHYAAMRIRGAVLDELRVEDWLPRGHRVAVEKGKASRVRVVFDAEEIGKSASPGDFETDLSRKRMSQRLIKYLDCLMPRERHIIMCHYFRDQLFKDIGDGMGISEPRVSQIHARAMKKLAECVPKGFLDDLD